MAALLTAGQHHESVLFLAVMNDRGQPEVTKIGLNRSPETEPTVLKENRYWCWRRKIEPLIPAPKPNAWGAGKVIRPARRKSMSGIHVVERLVGRQKQCRRSAVEGRPPQSDIAVRLCRQISKAKVRKKPSPSAKRNLSCTYAEHGSVSCHRSNS